MLARKTDLARLAASAASLARRNSPVSGSTGRAPRRDICILGVHCPAFVRKRLRAMPKAVSRRKEPGYIRASFSSLAAGAFMRTGDQVGSPMAFAGCGLLPEVSDTAVGILRIRLVDLSSAWPGEAGFLFLQS